MHRGGLAFYLSKNGVWLTHKIPVEYIEFPDELAREVSQHKPERHMPLIEFQTVQIRALLREDSAYDPFGDNERARNVSTTLRHPQAAFSEPRSVKDGA